MSRFDHVVAIGCIAFTALWSVWMLGLLIGLWD